MEEFIPGSRSKPRPDVAVGDWICPDPACGNVNFARRETCNRCDQEKSDSQKKSKLSQEIGKAAAEKSRGLFSADDWQCSKCGNVNWARRQTCNMCNAPKFGEVEERTGLGGGYNDRGVVEYVERQESSDDEYDEFGRKKKKRTASEIAADEKSKVYSVARSDDVEEDEEEEDEESDEDDGDLSKYDLSGWGDDDEKKDGDDSKQKEKDNKEREGRSRAKRESPSRSRSPSDARSKDRSRSRSESNSNSRSSGSSSSRSSSSRSSSSRSDGDRRRKSSSSRDRDRRDRR